MRGSNFCCAIAVALALLAMPFRLVAKESEAQSAVSGTAVPLDAFIKQDSFTTIKLSPTGDYYAVSVPLEDRTVLVILRRSDLKQVGMFNMRGKTHVADFWWVNDERIVIALGEKQGGLDQPVLTGELVATNADGTRQQMLYGYRLDGDKTGSKITGRKAAYASASVIDDLPDSENHILISVWPWSSATVEPFTEVERLDINSGRRVKVTKAPVRRANFVTDTKGNVRFAIGADVDNARKTYYRGVEGGWELINDESVSDIAMIPLAFSADDGTAYLQVEHKTGPDSIDAFDPATRKRTQLQRDDTVDPAGLIWAESPREPIGVLFSEGKPRAAFFDPAHPLAKLHAALQNSFGGDFALITSMTRDGKLGLIRTWSDRSPGDYYLFDLENKKADHVLSRRQAIDPARMGVRRTIAVEARDGMELHGYLTIPAGSDGKRLPMIVHPHGGPIGVADGWSFDRDAQLLASRGYAVLQLNFRGSGGYGRKYQRAGYREWGGKMQDDLTDATRWAIAQGIADQDRICIYGASYGGYASLMGVAKEPSLYQCAVGYVGVYDMPMMFGRGDIRQRISGTRYLEEALGTQDLEGISPNRLASQIKVPVFLAAGGKDERAPIEHSKMMERALQAVGVPVQTLYYDTEAHGFYTEEHNREYYTKLLAFFDRHIGKARKPAAGADR